MRRLFLIALCCLSFQIGTARPAQAWWEFIEAFSGPGPFWGPDLDIRLVCIMESRADASDRVLKWNAFGGIIVSACAKENNRKRKASFDLGFRFPWINGERQPGDPPDAVYDYANGHTVYFTTVQPSFTWRVTNTPSRDYVDLGTAVGLYWFSSQGFQSFNGTFLEPIRADIHFSSNLVEKLGKWAAYPLLRVSYLVFPAGFEPDAFAARAGLARRKGREGNISVGFWVDIDRVRGQ
jgi:hypothetical protein